MRRIVMVCAVAALTCCAPFGASAALVGYWSFDDTLAETSGFRPAGTHDGIAVGSPAYDADVPAGFGGKSISFNGTNSAVKVLNSNQKPAGPNGGASGAFPDNPNYMDTFTEQIRNGFTIAAWVKNDPSLRHDWDPYISKKGEDGNGYQLRRNGGSNYNSTLTIRGTSGDDDPQGSISTNDNNWHYIVGTWDRVTATRRLYIDGVLDAGGSLTGDVGSDAGGLLGGTATWEFLVFGARDTNSAINAFAKVKLDEVRIYSHALTQTEVQALMVPVPEPATLGLASMAGLAALACGRRRR